MTVVKIGLLTWNERNRNHIKRHGVTQEEVEEVCRGVYKQQPTYQNRYLIFGKTDKGRSLTIILARKKPGVYYVVTARDASKKERRRFFK